MKQNDWKRVYTPVSQEFHEALLTAAQSVREEQPVMKKRIGILVVALVLALAAGTALAIVSHYSVRDYQAGGNPSAEFEEHIVELGKTYETDEITLTVGDAVFDGTGIAIAMDITSKNPDKPVYIYPKLTAWCGDRQLDLDIVGMRGDFMSGFLFPSLDEDYREGKYGFDAVLYEDEADGPVTWNLTMQVLKPNWPVVRAQEIVTKGADGQTLPIEVQLKPFRDAYENHEIWITNGDSPVEYAAALPVPEGMTEEEWWRERLGAQLAQSGAFTLADTLECTFVAAVPESTKLAVGAGETFPFEEYTIEFIGMDVSFTRASYTFERVYPKGTTVAMPEQAYALMDQNETLLEIAGHSIGKPETRVDGAIAVRYWGEVTIQGDVPTIIRFVPLAQDEDGQVIDPPNYDEAHAFTVQIDMEGRAQ